MNLLQELQNIGLSDKEAKVYLANLELGQSSVQNIAKKAGVNRATTYVILNSLIKKGLCSTFEQDKKTLYVASDPNLLEGVFEVQKKELEEKQRYFQTIVPQLNLINNRQTDKPKVKFFEGKQGLINCFIEFTGYNGGKDDYFRLAFHRDRLEKIFTPEENARFREMRKKNQGSSKSKVLYNSKVPISDTTDALRIRLDEDKFPLPCDIGVFGDNIRILSESKELSGILIVDHDIATTLRSLFELAWEAAEARAKKSKAS